MSQGELKYLSVNPRDEAWGIMTTSIGYQFIQPNGEYPLIGHPKNYNFNQNGRVLNEYQLIYIVKGSGFFTSSNHKKEKIGAGTIILLFPGEWHNYYPIKKTGWDEYWVGFRGNYIDQQIKNKFFIKEKPIFNIGLKASIIEIYKTILYLAELEKKGYQQIVSSMVVHLLGEVYYGNINAQLDEDTYSVNKINEAKLILRNNISNSITAKSVAKELNVGYSWFRQMFKKHTGFSPMQYQLQQKMLLAKELLSNPKLSISDIAFKLGFLNVGQFSTFFKQREGIAPTTFRKTVE